MEPLELPDKPVCMSGEQHDWQIVYNGSLINKNECMDFVEPSVKPVCIHDNGYDWQLDRMCGQLSAHVFGHLIMAVCSSAPSNRINCIGSCAAVAALHVQLWRCQAAVA